MEPDNNAFNQETKRKKKTIFTKEQLAVLEETFSKDSYVGKLTTTFLATQLNLSEKCIRVWFQNRRNKQKQQLRESLGWQHQRTIMPPEHDEPVPTEPGPYKPVPTEPGPYEQVPTEPGPYEPVPTESGPYIPVLTEPGPYEPVPTEPEYAKPEPTESIPTEPKYTKAEPAESISIKLEPAEPKPIEPELGELKPIKPKAAELEPVEPEPAKPKPVEPEPIEPESPEPKPIDLELIEPEPIKPEQVPAISPSLPRYEMMLQQYLISNAQREREHAIRSHSSDQDVNNTPAVFHHPIRHRLPIVFLTSWMPPYLNVQQFATISCRLYSQNPITYTDCEESNRDSSVDKHEEPSSVE